MLVLNPYPQTPFPQKGAECGAAALTPLGATPQTPYYLKYMFIDRLKPLLLRSGQLSAYYSDVVVPEDAVEEVSLSALLSAEEAEASDDVSSSLVMFSFS